jgi:DNA-nicking Smr family endonuclease
MRKLRDDEQQLWDRLKETVRPLSRRHSFKKKAAPPPPKAPERTPVLATQPGKTKAKPSPAAPPRVAAIAKPAAPALAPFEEKTLRRLSRGLVAIDDRIDLHGMSQERAHSALNAFLRRSQARGDRIVLVVTGKGQEHRQGGRDRRGVLRAFVPTWLGQPALRDLVVGFEKASRRHGGDGALYVRIRRRRETRPSIPRA